MRSLEPDGITNRFSNDGTPPQYGHRLRSPHRWRWEAVESQGGLSVNLVDCLASARCASFLHGTPARFEHVTIIDLAELAAALKLKLVAQYNPITDTPSNPCHFDIIPTDVSVEDLRVQLRLWVESVYKSSCKIPTTKPAIESGDANKRKYEAVFRILPNVNISVPCSCELPALIETSEGTTSQISTNSPEIPRIEK